MILPILGGSGTHFGTTKAYIWDKRWLEIFETIINQLSGVENMGIGTKMNVLVLLVSEI